jgi:sugar phosphate permease
MLLVIGTLVVAISHVALWAVVREGTDPGYWPLAAGLFIGGLGLGLVVPILINVILAGVPARDAGSAGGVHSTAIQIGGALGIGTLSTAFFARAKHYGPALGVVLVASAIVYVVAALVMLMLPKAAPRL